MLPSRVNRLVLLSMTGVLLAQAPIDNEGVMKLVKSGMTEDMVISVIQKQPGSYVLGADDFVTLKAAGVSEKIISAMLAKGKGEAPAGAPASAALAVAGPSQRATISGPGLYYKKGNEYFELLDRGSRVEDQRRDEEHRQRWDRHEGSQGGGYRPEQPQLPDQPDGDHLVPPERHHGEFIHPASDEAQ